MNCIRLFIVASVLSLSATATPLTWYLDGVTFVDGGSASGSFVFDADAGAPCGTLVHCGLFSNVNIVTTSGSGMSGAVYTVVCGTDLASCGAGSPDFTQVVFLTSTSPDQSGQPFLQFIFSQDGISGGGGLTNLGGTVDISGQDVTGGVVNEMTCFDGNCAQPNFPFRFSITGSVEAEAVPEPSSALLAGGAAALFGLMRLRRFRVNS